MNHVQGLFSTKYYDKVKSQMLKHKIIEIQNYPNLMKFMSEDSIILDDETLNSLEKDFIEECNQVLSEYTSVFVKLNFSAATDTDFLVHEAKCFNLKDILTILKGSTRINENYSVFLENKGLENNTSNKLYLILKPWYKIDNRDEFRIFLIKSELKGICQRYLNFYFDYSQDEINEIKESIIRLYQSHLVNLKDDDNLIIDLLYLRKLKKVKIIDIISQSNLEVLKKHNINHNLNQPEESELLLFHSWNTLQSITDGLDIGNVFFKVVNSHKEIFETKENLNKFPIEITGEDKEFNVAKIIDFLRENND
jgi:hypothetical protein